MYKSLFNKFILIVFNLLINNIVNNNIVCYSCAKDNKIEK